MCALPSIAARVHAPDDCLPETFKPFAIMGEFDRRCSYALVERETGPADTPNAVSRLPATRAALAEAGCYGEAGIEAL